MDPNRNARDDRGIALVLSLFLMMAMSVVGASLMFLSQTETYSSMNYRLMSQARYGAESGIQTTVNYLINS
jgi:type II secretory pathway component PulK